MTVLESLCQAVRVRQIQRANLCEPDLKEMWVTKETWKLAKRDAEMYMIQRNSSVTSNTCMGVLIRIIGEDE